MRFVNLYFENEFILHEILVGPRDVMVPVGVFKNNIEKYFKKSGIYIDNMGWAVNMQKTSLLYWSSRVYSQVVISLSLAKQIIITTTVFRFAARNLVRATSPRGVNNILSAFPQNVPF